MEQARGRILRATRARILRIHRRYLRGRFALPEGHFPLGGAAGFLALLAALVPGDLGPGGGPALPSSQRLTAGPGIVRVIVRDPSGQPARAVRVRLVDANVDDTDEGSVLQTNEVGTVEFQGLAKQLWAVTIEAPTCTRETKHFDGNEGNGVLEVRLRPAGKIAGRVSSIDGRPIHGAEVRVVSERATSAPPWTARTDAHGRFTFDTLERGGQTIAVSARGFENVQQERPLGSAAVTLSFVLRPTSVIAGRVIDPSGSGARGASVSVGGSGVWPPRTEVTGHDGTFRFVDVPGGVYQIQATHGALVSDPLEGFTLEPGAQATVELRLYPGRTLSGVVVDGINGRAIEGASIVVSEDAFGLLHRSLRTDANGRFVVDGLRPRPQRVIAQHAGYVATTRNVPNTESSLRIAMERTAMIRGIVVDENGQAIVGARLEVIGRSTQGEPIAIAPVAASTPGNGMTQGWNLGVVRGPVPPIPAAGLPVALQPGTSPDELSGYVSGSSGDFEIPDVPPGQLQLIARHATHAPNVVGPLTVRPGTIVENVRVVLHTAGAIEGRVVDGGGAPVAYVPIEVQRSTPLPRELAFAGADGTFRVEGALGPVSLTAMPNGERGPSTRVVVEAGATVPVEIVLGDALVTLSGRVFDERGFPIGAARVSVTAQESGAQRTAVSNDDGTFTATSLPGPPYHVEAEHAEYATTRLEIARIDGELRITLRAGAQVRGLVRDAWDDSAVSGATIKLAREGGATQQTAASDTRGNFEVSRVPPGNYTLIITHGNYAPARRDVRLAPSASGLLDSDIGIVRLDPASEISGGVVDAIGEPVPNATVRVRDGAGSDHSTQSDRTGHFRVRGVPAGLLTVRASHGSAGETLRDETIRVAPRESVQDMRLRLRGRYIPTADDSASQE